MIIKCIIIDDEPLAAMLIEGYVAKTPYLELLATFSSGIEAIHSDKLSEAELIFCDIQMPTLNGLEFSRMVKEDTRIIFTTAFNEYALDGFKVNAIDYLVKPISYNDFLASSQKALDWFEMKKRAEASTTVANKNSVDSIYVKSDYKLIRIELSKLLYVEGLKDYVKMVVDQEPKPILSLMNIGRVEELLPSDEFIRVHRSFIVRKDKINVIERNRIIFDKEAIPIGDIYKSALKKYLNERTL
ncbi:MAG: LytTR family DNA-binding domain-containing protein [Rikenellaceae bacterium]